MISYRDIRDILQVSVGFITASRQRYERAEVGELRSNYWGTRGYLTAAQKQELFTWLGQQEAWTLEEVMAHLEDEYEVVYQSPQSYYALLKLAGFSWKKAQPVHPDKNQTLVEEKKQQFNGYWQCIVPRLPKGECESCF